MYPLVQNRTRGTRKRVEPTRVQMQYSPTQNSKPVRSCQARTTQWRRPQHARQQLAVRARTTLNLTACGLLGVTNDPTINQKNEAHKNERLSNDTRVTTISDEKEN